MIEQLNLKEAVESMSVQKRYHDFLLLPDPFRRMGAWRKTMESQKPGNCQRPGPEVVKKQRVAKERAAQKVRSWTVQNEIRVVLGRVSAGAAVKDSQFCESLRDQSLTEGCIHCSVDEREHSESEKGAQVPRWKSRKPVSRRIWMRQYASSPRKNKIGYERQEERDYKGLQRAKVALPVWPAHQPRRSPGETSVRGPIVA